MAVRPAELVRQAVMARLSADFATVNAAVAASYGVPQLAIDFGYPSRNFVHGYLDAAGFDASTAGIDLPGMCFYVSECVHEAAAKDHRFSGTVVAHLDTYLVYRALRDEPTVGNDIGERLATFDPELLVNGAEESILDSLTDPSARAAMAAAGVSLVRYRTERDVLDGLGDGVSQRLGVVMEFKVHVR
jgi:hypothetical protein